jgi:tetratricopeptide (TPR) repeat protein
MSEPPFEHIAWFSARDVDLTPKGPKKVQPQMQDLRSAAETFGKLFGVDSDIDTFKMGLGGEHEGSLKTLFVFDNFETINEKNAFQQFLADNTRLPNRVLITSRERDFQADMPLEVSGMDWDQAAELLGRVSKSLGIEALVNERTAKQIFDSAEGHAYVMRLLLGELAVSGQMSGMSQVMTRDDRVLNAVFERSYELLSEAGRSVFLTIGNWTAAIPEISLVAVLGKRGFEVLDAVDECVRLALIERGALKGGDPCYSSPKLARQFASRKLTGDPDRLMVQGDLDELRSFGVISITGEKPSYAEIMTDYERYCISRARQAPMAERKAIAETLERIANYWTEAWLILADFQAKAGFSQDTVLATTQRAVEAMPENKKAWRYRLNQAHAMNREEIVVATQIELANLEPTSEEQLRETVGAVLGFIAAHEESIPGERRQSYIRGVRGHMTKVADSLTPSGLEQLGHLYLLDEDEEQAYRYAEMGTRINPRHKGCAELLERLKNRGFRPT